MGVRVPRSPLRVRLCEHLLSTETLLELALLTGTRQVPSISYSLLAKSYMQYAATLLCNVARRGGRVVEGTRLLSGFLPKGGTGVRISPSPCAAGGGTADGNLGI